MEAVPGKLPRVTMEFDDPRAAEIVAEFFEQHGMTVEREPPLPSPEPLVSAMANPLRRLLWELSDWESLLVVLIWLAPPFLLWLLVTR